MPAPRFTDDAIASALAASNGDPYRAAVAIGCSPSTIYAAMRRLEAAARGGPDVQAPTPAPPLPLVAAPQTDADAILADLEATTDNGVDHPTPDPRWIVREYFKTLTAMADSDRPDGKGKMNVLLLGCAGTGKTAAAREYAARKGWPFFAYSLGRSLSPIFGRPAVAAVNGASRTLFVWSRFVGATRRYPEGVLLLDEVNHVTDPAAEVPRLLEFLEDRTAYIPEARNGRGERFALPAAWRIIMACNPAGAGFAGAQKMNGALSDRAVTLRVPRLSEADVRALIRGRGVKDPAVADLLARVFTEAADLADVQRLWIQVSVRALDRAIVMLRIGATIAEALHTALVAPGEPLGDVTGQDAMAGLIKAKIPPDVAGQKVTV